MLDLTGEECTGVGHRRWECMTAFLGWKYKGGGDHYPFVVLFCVWCVFHTIMSANELGVEGMKVPGTGIGPFSLFEYAVSLLLVV